MDSLIKLVVTVGELYEKVGPLWSFTFLLMILGLPVVYTIWKDFKIHRAYNTALDAKEDQIVRVAEENRMWRAYFFKEKGLKDKEVERILTGFNPTTKQLNMKKGGDK